MRVWVIAAVLFFTFTAEANRFRKQYENTLSFDDRTNPLEIVFDDTFSETNVVDANEIESGARVVLSSGSIERGTISLDFGSITTAKYAYIRADAEVYVRINLRGDGLALSGTVTRLRMTPNKPTIIHSDLTSVEVQVVSGSSAVVRYLFYGRD